jgi:hypothetical protein
MPEPIADREGHMAMCVRVGIDNADLRLDDRILAPA